jgi:hypothetical protein
MRRSGCCKIIPGTNNKRFRAAMNCRSFQRAVATLVTTFALAGCIAMQNIEGDTKFTASSPGAIVVIGVSPAYRIGVKRGTVTPATFQNSELRVFDFNAAPVDGYVVASVPVTAADESFAITQVWSGGFGEKPFMPCDGRGTMTFKTRPGEVLYLGDYRYSPAQKQLQIEYRQDLEKARAYMRQRYPQIVPDLTPADIVHRQVRGLPCMRTLYIYY